jgi:hypothetical protein
MRASLKIDDDIYEEARRRASSENRRIGEVLSDLARRALRAEMKTGKESGFPRFSIPEDSPQITMEMVKSAESDS